MFPIIVPVFLFHFVMIRNHILLLTVTRREDIMLFVLRDNSTVKPVLRKRLRKIQSDASRKHAYIMLTS